MTSGLDPKAHVHSHLEYMAVCVSVCECTPVFPKLNHRIEVRTPTKHCCPVYFAIECDFE